MRLTALFQRLVSAPEFGPLVLLVVEILVFTVRSPAFLSTSNISNLLAFTPELGMITLGMTLLMTAGEFDLSVGSVFGFAPIMMWTFYNTHAGSLEIGFWIRHRDFRSDRLHQWVDGYRAQNSIIPGDAWHAVCRARHRFVRHRWVSSAYLDCQLRIDESHRRTIFRWRLRIYASLLWFILFTVILGYVLTESKAGNWIQAAGGNEYAARARGVRVTRTKILLFILTAVISAYAGVTSSIRVSAANPNSGTGYELEVIAMVVIGGTALTGGRGTIIGTIIGVLILRMMRNGIVLVGVPGLAYNILLARSSSA